MTSTAKTLLRLSLPFALALGCGRLADGEDREGFSTYGADDEDDALGEEEPGSGGEISESCYDGIVQPGEVCQVQVPSLPSGIDPCALEVADFDSDGRPDLAVPNSDWLLPTEGTHYSHVLRGYGNGNFGEAVAWDSGAALPVGIAVGDFDGDGDADIATANYEANATFVLTNQGGMSFAAPVGEDIGGVASSVHAGDFDNDGIDDLVVVSQTGLALVRNTAAGAQLWSQISLDSAPMHAELVDLDADGNLDLATVVTGLFGGPGELIVFHGAGDGSFPERVVHPIGTNPWWVSAGDLNMDGDLDLLVSDNGDNTVSILLGSGHGGFAKRTTLGVCFGPQAAQIADMNLDGANDIVVGCMDSDRVELWLQGEDGEFELTHWWQTGSRPVSLRVADLNLDTVPDIAWANQLSNTVGLVLSQP